MAKTVKKKQSENKPSQVKNDKLAVGGSFMDILKASGKHANNNSAKKKP